MRKSAFFFLSVLSLILMSCSSDGEKKKGDRSGLIQVAATGRISELLVVMEESWKTGPAGQALSQVFEEDLPGLPQSEAYFQLIPIKPAAFGSIFKTHRNILMVKVGDSSSVSFKKNVFAKGQEMVVVTVDSQEEFARVMNQVGPEIRSTLYQRELDRMVKGYKNLVDPGLKRALGDLGVELPVPNDFVPVVQEDDFLWLRRELPKATQGILVYRTEFLNDFQMRPSQILALRDSLTKVHVFGQRDGSYMQTEYRYPPHVEDWVVDDFYGVKVRGLWRMENDFMGGPFITVAVLDEANSRIYFIDAFTFAPEMDKRSLVMQLDAILAGLSLD